MTSTVTSTPAPSYSADPAASARCEACQASDLGVCVAHPFDARRYRASLDPEDRAMLRREKRRGWTPSS